MYISKKHISRRAVLKGMGVTMALPLLDAMIPARTVFANTAAGEVCDTGGQSATCNANCTAPVCGDGITNTAAGEACDTSGQSATCNANCTTPMCGDHIVNSAAGEACDTGGQSATWNANCTTPCCGRGAGRK